MEDDREKEADEIVRRLSAPPVQPNRNGVLIPMIRRIIPSLIANEIIGVQPMTGAVGEIYSIKYNITEHDKSE